MSKLIIDRVRQGQNRGDYVWKLVSANGEFVNGSRPETFANLADMWHNIDLVAGIKAAEVVDKSGGYPD